jgi:hypothetical protein
VKVKTARYVIAAMLSALLVTAAAAKPRHHAPADGAGPSVNARATADGSSASPQRGQSGAPDDKANVGASDQHGVNSGKTGENGPLKRGEIPGKLGQGRVNDEGEKLNTGNTSGPNHPAAVRAGTNGAQPGSDAIRTDNVIVERHNDKKKPYLPKKLATPSPLHLNVQRPASTNLGPTRNAAGVVVNTPNTQLGKDDKLDPKGAPSATGNSPITDREVSHHPLFRPASSMTTVNNSGGVNGTTINRPGVNPGTIGGAAKNVASINGSSFRPRH